MKAVANAALSGTDADVKAAWKDWHFGFGPLGEAQTADEDAARARRDAFRVRQESSTRRTSRTRTTTASAGGTTTHRSSAGTSSPSPRRSGSSPTRRARTRRPSRARLPWTRPRRSSPPSTPPVTPGRRTTSRSPATRWWDSTTVRADVPVRPTTSRVCSASAAS
ncbi:hypothetical protein [Streptomyces sp. AM8-1-1]|uniref:hypothetical protein n=1 Tax=Streptomyces sp. AM8-1-1 TaxID=3075825 RepID=UPI0028C3FF77|nr:hypothetical protein [Streptomyces sp. AM8-1-1]WNO77138.1 hypothetical protein RPQ07_11500 [Streptomyces sp. AM8-1-1]